MHLLQELNPFFEGKKKIEEGMFIKFVHRQNEHIAYSSREKYMLLKEGVPTHEIKLEYRNSKWCGANCVNVVRSNTDFSRKNVGQVFDKEFNLSWFLPINNSNNFHNGYEWNLKLYKSESN